MRIQLPTSVAAITLLALTSGLASQASARTTSSDAAQNPSQAIADPYAPKVSFNAAAG